MSYPVMKNNSLLPATLAVGIMALSFGAARADAAVIINDTFDYADLPALQAAWGSNAGLSLDLTAGNGAPSAAHSGDATVHISTTAFSLIPTNAEPIRLTADLWYSGTSNQRNTVGLRNGANPLFEVGFYNSGGVGLSVRILNFSGNENWVTLLPYTAGELDPQLGVGPASAQWIRVEATISGTSTTVTYDLGANGSVDGSFTSTGPASANPFTDLRFGGPSGLSSAGGGFMVDNIRLETIPEPATAAFAALGLLGILRRRRR